MGNKRLEKLYKNGLKKLKQQVYLVGNRSMEKLKQSKKCKLYTHKWGTQKNEKKMKNTKR